MNRAVIVLIIIYVISALGGLYLFSKKTTSTTAHINELISVNAELSLAKTVLEKEKSSRIVLEQKIMDARTNGAFLALALCPALEATNKDALCIKNGTEWLSQTILAGTTLTSPEAKTKMDALLVALSKKTKPTAKQLYEMLRPVEVDALRALVDGLSKI